MEKILEFIISKLKLLTNKVNDYKINKYGVKDENPFDMVSHLMKIKAALDSQNNQIFVNGGIINGNRIGTYCGQGTTGTYDPVEAEKEQKLRYEKHFRNINNGIDKDNYNIVFDYDDIDLKSIHDEDETRWDFTIWSSGQWNDSDVNITNKMLKRIYRQLLDYEKLITERDLKTEEYNDKYNNNEDTWSSHIENIRQMKEEIIKHPLFISVDDIFTEMEIEEN